MKGKGFSEDGYCHCKNENNIFCWVNETYELPITIKFAIIFLQVIQLQI